MVLIAVKRTFPDITDRNQGKDFLCLPSPIKYGFMLCPEAVAPPNDRLKIGTFNLGEA